MTGNLKPCPFCGGEAFVNADEIGDTNLAHVMCSECWASGPERDDGTEHVAWNTRTDLSQKEIALTKELLAINKHNLALCRDREPHLSELLREQIRLENRLRALLAERDTAWNDAIKAVGRGITELQKNPIDQPEMYSWSYMSACSDALAVVRALRK